MKRLIKTLLLMGTVCLCFLFGLSLTEEEAQAASYKEVTVYNETQLKNYCSSTNVYYKINLGNDITVTSSVYVAGDKIIDGKGYSIKRNPNMDYFNMMTFKKNADVELMNVKLISTELSSATRSMTILHVVESSHLTTSSGFYIEGGGEGSNITCIAAYGTVTMNGGTVKGSDEGGVRIIGPGTHTINDIEATGNIAGIAVHTSEGDELLPRVINLNGGKTYKNLHDGLLVWGTSTYEANITLNINNFESYSNGVTGNYSGLDVYDTSGVTVNIKNFKCYDNSGMGIWFSSGEDNVLNIDGESKGCVQIYNNLHGMYVGSDLVQLYVNNAKIYNNVNYGIYINRSSVNNAGTYSVANSVEVCGNGLSGVYLRNTNIKSGASVYSNKSSGVFLMGASEYVADEGVIRDNTSHGVNLGMTSKISGKGVIYGNNTGIYAGPSNGTYIGGVFDIYENVASGLVIEGNAYNTSKLSVDGDIVLRNNGLYGVYFNMAEATIKGATISSNSKGVNCGIGTLAMNDSYVYDSGECGIYVLTDGVLSLNNGVRVRDNKQGIYIAGTLISDATVYNNDLKGIYVDGGKSDILSGYIYGNDSGIVAENGATVNISSGKIHKNTNYGVSCDNSAVSVTNAEITNNRLGILALNSSNVTVNSGKIHTNSEQGIGMKDSSLTVKGGEIYSNTKNGVYIATESDFTMTGGKIYSNSNHGVQNSGGGNINISGGEIHSNTKNAFYLADGTVLNITGGKLHSNGIYSMYLASGAKVNISGGEITGNKNYAIKLAGGSEGTITGGNIHANGGAYGEIYHETDKLVVTGTYNGKSSVNGYIYLAKANNYVTTDGSECLLSIYPSAYTSGRRCILTSSNAKALVQKNSKLKEKDDWLFAVNGNYVVLSMIPGIYYDGVIIEDSLILPSADGWYNAKTISGIKKFTAVDDDGDLVSFDLYYNGKLLKKGTVSGGNGSVTYDFKTEGIREYEFVAVDSLGNKASKKVTIRVDLTPPSLLDVSKSEIDWGNSGSEPTFSWSVAVVKPDASFTQQGTDALSGVASVAMYMYSDQKTSVKRIFSSPFKITSRLNNYPAEKGIVLKVVDKAGNECYKCILNEDNLDIKVQPFYPTK